MTPLLPCSPFFFFNDTATTEIYTLSLHDALPIFSLLLAGSDNQMTRSFHDCLLGLDGASPVDMKTRRKMSLSRRSRRRSEEHTSELQSRLHLVCRLLLEKKKK